MQEKKGVTLTGLMQENVQEKDLISCICRLKRYQSFRTLAFCAVVRQDKEKCNKRFDKYLPNP